MRSTILSATMVLTTSVLAAPINQTLTPQVSFADNPTAYMKGFRNPTIQSSVGGQAICIAGVVDVTASADNFHINSQGPADQVAVTELVLELVSGNSTVAEKLIGGKNPVTGTYGIYSQLCFPNGSINATTIQFLTHGLLCGRDYWNNAPDYSYVDSAAQAGYTTFLYDRVGTGLSDHPDPVQTVQGPLHVAIAHELIQLLRTGGIASHTFEHVVGVGHSFGSITTTAVTSQHPDDLDAAVLTGFATGVEGAGIAFAGGDFAIASQNEPLRFANLSSGYLTSASIIGTQFSFFRAPNFDSALLKIAEATKQIITVGELLTGNSIVKPSTNFKGPIDVVNPEHDLPNCNGDCLVPDNLSAAVKAELYPAASNGSSWYVAPGAGHVLNYHYGALEAYEHIQNFIKKNGF